MSDQPETEPVPEKSDKQQESEKNQQAANPEQPSVTDESIQAELHAYAAALRAEFQMAQEQNTEPDVEKHTRDFFKKNVQDAALQVVWLAHNSDSDSIRLKACTFIIKEAFEAGVKDGDPIKDLMRDLMGSAS